jgi:hypothetical protein
VEAEGRRKEERRQREGDFNLLAEGEAGRRGTKWLEFEEEAAP